MKQLLLAVILLVGCQPGAGAGTPTASPVKLRNELLYDGFVVPKNATELRAPQNTFRIAGWNSNSSWIKLIHVVEDGAEVKEGDVIGKFEFPGDRARPQVDAEIRKAEAQRDRSGLSQQEEVDRLTSEQKQKVIDAAIAELETQKRGVISERDWQLAAIAHRQAEFDAEATGKHRTAVKRALAAEAAYQERNVERAQSLDERFKTYEQRFKVLAPHGGVVRHAYHRRRGRKIQKGDGMPSGMHFASVARDEEVRVKFFVPERHFAELEGADEFVVESRTSSEKSIIKVVEIEAFPQEMGFLKNDRDLPNARERAYVIWATFHEQPEKLSAGVEVRVRKR
jgi:multidrug efflux pump subunit AcrA (membrane-fusion protein)